MNARRKRSLAPLVLTKSPLVLVLCQVRIAAIRAMANYIPKVQDRLRREGFPIDVSTELREVSLRNREPAIERSRQHWEFRTMDESWSIIVGEEAVVLQTTAYSNFDEFSDRLSLGMGALADASGDLVVERIGLRYIDAIVPGKGESWKDYVKSGYHGQENDIIQSERSVIFVQTVAETGTNQRMIARIAQNREGMFLPPDLVPHHPQLHARAEHGQLLTLLDLDHFREERRAYDQDVLIDTAWALHDGLDILFRDMVTEHALEVWE